MDIVKFTCSALLCTVLLGFSSWQPSVAQADIERITVQEMYREYKKISEKTNANLFWDQGLRAIYPSFWQAVVQGNGVLFNGATGETISAKIVPLAFFPETFQAVATAYAKSIGGKNIVLTDNHLEFTTANGVVRKLLPFDDKLVLITGTGSGPAFNKVLSSIAPQDYDLEVTDLTIQCQDNILRTKKLTIVYPTVTIYGQDAISKKISRIFVRDTKDSKNRYLEVNGKDNLLTEEIKHKPSFHNNKYLCFLQSGYDNMAGAAHPTSWLEGITFDLSTGEKVLWQALVRDDDADSFSLASINAKILDDTKTRGLSLFLDFKGLKKLPKNYYLDKNGIIHFIFGQYEIAPYSSGIIDINMEKMCKD